MFKELDQLDSLQIKELLGMLRYRQIDLMLVFQI